MLRVVPKVLTSGAREETQFGLFGHGRITDFGDSDPGSGGSDHNGDQGQTKYYKWKPHCASP